MRARYNLLSRDAERDLLPAAEALGMTLAAWSPLAGGVLSGKFSNPGDVVEPTRVPADTISQRDHAVAQEVRDVANEVGASASQVALAWTMTHSPAIHPNYHECGYEFGASRLTDLAHAWSRITVAPVRKKNDALPPSRDDSDFQVSK